jgi:GNAT superfamily N-acetyltransferase
MAWWDTPGSDDLRQERGEDLAAFALRLGAPPRTIVLEREVLVRPIYHGRGYGKEIRIRAHDVIRATFPKALVLTRMREDNAPILAIGTKMGFARTGIRMPSRNPKTFHEYWYRDLATS